MRDDPHCNTKEIKCPDLGGDERPLGNGGAWEQPHLQKSSDTQHNSPKKEGEEGSMNEKSFPAKKSPPFFFFFFFFSLSFLLLPSISQGNPPAPAPAAAAFPPPAPPFPPPAGKDVESSFFFPPKIS